MIKPLKIGSVTLPNNLILAPMAGVTDLPFRLLCKEQGAGLLCMEMVSAKAILYKNRNTESLLEISQHKDTGIWRVSFGFSTVFFATYDEALAYCKGRFFDLDGKAV